MEPLDRDPTRQIQPDSSEKKVKNKSSSKKRKREEVFEESDEKTRKVGEEVFQSPKIQETTIPQARKAIKKLQNVLDRDDRFELGKIFNQIKMGAKEGNAESQYWLGFLYNREGENQKAVKAYQQAADQKHPKAEYEIGRIYLTGENEQDKDEEKGIEYLQRAANQGNRLAMYALATEYKFFEYIIQLAEKGSPEEQSNIAWLYLHGEAGLKKSIPSAMEYFRKAALNPNSSDDLKQKVTDLIDLLGREGR